MPQIKAVLFDLDGTLADTAQDLAYALNQVLIEQGQSPLPFETIRPVVSHGGIALIKLGFKLSPEDERFDPLRQRLLSIYENNICQKTVLFPQIQEILNDLTLNEIKWGIVTNKPGWLTYPLLDAMKITPAPETVVCGDTLEQRKPHPAPLLHACKEMNLLPEQCIYTRSNFFCLGFIKVRKHIVTNRALNTLHCTRISIKLTFSHPEHVIFHSYRR